MCIVIDTNAISVVFSKNNSNHREFSDVLSYIESGNGFIVIGGTKYKEELIKMSRYMKIINLMSAAGRVVKIVDEVVDQQQIHVESLTKNTSCDDPHIVALLGASHCDLLCSLDKRSYKFIKDRNLYPQNSPIVSIYTGCVDARILVPKDKSELKNISPG